MVAESLTLFKNGHIYTMDQNETTCDAMTLFRDTIVAVGTEQDVSEISRTFIQDTARNAGLNLQLEVVDLGGKVIVPGFIDTHMHPIIAIYYKTQLDLSGIQSYAELGNVLRKDGQLKAEGEWVLGVDLMEERFVDPAERRFPDRYTLDALLSDRPVLIFRYDGHICTTNSMALDLMGVNAESVREIQSVSGEIQVDASGKPTGIFTEDATNYAIKKVPVPKLEKWVNVSKAFSDELAGFGITTCGIIIQEANIGIGGELGSFELPVLQTLLKEGIIKQDLVLYLVTNAPKRLARIQKTFAKTYGDTNPYRVQGIKVYADGDFGASTACMFDPFSDSPDKKTGFMVMEKDKIKTLFQEAITHGFDIACHAIGDKGNRIVVDIFKEIATELKNSGESQPFKGVRCRIEHASIIRPDAIQDAAKLGVIIATQPLFINTEYTWLEKRLGAARLPHVYPFKSFLDAGIVVAGASDMPVECPDVLKAIQVAVTRNGFVPAQAITVKQALKLFTCNAAYALKQEKIKGSLEKGKLADFVILDEDITKIPASKIAGVKIIATYHRGVKIWQTA